MTQPTQPANSLHPPQSDMAQLNERIAQLTAQLKQENESIARLIERQRQLRYQLLRAREQSIAALRHESQPSPDCKIADGCQGSVKTKSQSLW